MRRAAFVLCVAAALLLMAAPAQAGRADCGPAAARTVAQSKLLRVFVVRPEPALKSYYACLRSGSRPFYVAAADNDSRGRSDNVRQAVKRLLLRGVYVTSLWTSCPRGGGSCDYRVSVGDVKRRRDVVSTYGRRGEVETLVASRRGEAAFLARDREADTYVVQKLDDFGTSERDRGDRLHDLRLSGRRIHWRNGAVRHRESIRHVRRCGPSLPDKRPYIGRSGSVYGIDPPGEGGDRTEYYACLYSGGRPLLLGSDHYGGMAYNYLAEFQIVRGYVGWFEYGCYMGCLTTLHVADLHRRTVRKGESAVGNRFVLNGRGFAAIVGRTPDPGTHRLYAFDSAGQRLIDSGDGIDPASVAIEADAITWRHGDEHRREALR